MRMYDRLWEQGYHDALVGYPLDGCPYPTDSEDYLGLLDGFLAYQADNDPDDNDSDTDDDDDDCDDDDDDDTHGIQYGVWRPWGSSY